LARADLPRLGEDRCHLSTALADAYGQTGQWSRARELIPALSEESCRLVNTSSAGSVAWTRFAVARSQGKVDAAALRVELSDAVALARKPPSDSFVVAVASLNLALFELHVGELEAAERALDGFDALGSARGHFGAFDALHARGEIALRRGQPRDALGFFERALARARSDAAGQASDAEWRALFGQGLALRALKKDAEGLARLRAAVEVQERAGLRTALRAGRAAFFDDRRALAAGGGLKGGLTYGETDEIGWGIVRDPVDLHDFHATMLNQFGFDHLKLTHRFSGRDFRLTDVSGRVIKEWIA
jgi:tetratricopeptide (TPR) repeat protein